jgi:tartrate dehydrogenase/decarboxylase/D-malate dehydrogenase
VIVRENSEDEYAGVGGRMHRGLPEEVATDVSVMTRAGVTRIMLFAFALARAAAQATDGGHQVESPVPRHGHVGRDRADVAGEFPDVNWDKMLMNVMIMRVVLRPQMLDTIVAIPRV